ncbi:MAG: class I SAM-dependent methyltransferase [Candidatus Levybacteria bacterium]|nr:class I SAM-dependent methyltransferase [Candidatus Levybacteria bacterium]
MTVKQLYKKDIFEKMGLSFKKGNTLLDVGCGDGDDDKIFIEKYSLKTWGTDIYKDKNIKNIKALNFKKGSIYKIPFKDNSFDYVFLHDVLHHIDEKNQSTRLHLDGLKELRRVCKRGGKIIILEANRYNPLFYPHMVKMEGHNHFTKGYFIRIIRSIFPRSQFKYFEAHAYPSFVRFPFKIFEFFMEKVPFLEPFRAYNLAIVNNEKKE